MRVRLAIALVVIAAFGAAPACALATSAQDHSSTRVALRASDAAVKAIVDTWPAEEASFHRLDLQFAAECPGVGAGAPQNGPEQKLTYEAVGALWSVGYRVDAKITQAFIRAVSPLRWSNPAITRRMRAFIRGLREMLALPVPNLCADVRAWTASGYQTIPASTLRYDQHVEAIDVEIPPPQLIAPYVPPAERGLLAQFEHYNTRFDELEFSTGQDAWIKLLEVVGLDE